MNDEIEVLGEESKEKTPNEVQNPLDDNNNKPNKKQKNKKSKKLVIIIIILILCIGLGTGTWYFFLRDTEKPSEKKVTTNKKEVQSEYRITSNALTNFDLSFLRLENEEKNKVYSPLSIKYALEMLSEGAKGDTKTQIDSIIGEYKANKYTNSTNMSLANAMFIKNSVKDSIKTSYIDNLQKNYNAEVIYDSFETPTVLNNWVSEKTFKLIDNLFDNINSNTFILVNALAIDMEWVKKIQSEEDVYSVNFPHEDFSSYVSPLVGGGYHSLDFNKKTQKAKSVEIAAVANKYDIINEVGEDKIRETVGKAYQEWLASGESCSDPAENPDVDTYLNKYIEEIGTSYKHISSSTDFYFYDDKDVKAFAKDLKEYNGTTLQYVGIMPKNDNLTDYVKNTDTEAISSILDGLKDIKLDNFDDKVITSIKGYIPMFNFDYELKLVNDLKQLGIKDVFDSTKSDLSNLTTTKGSYIDEAKHKANIEFSNDGIKAAAATAAGGMGAASCGFEYNYEVPIKEIDLTFDNPYLFLIRDKKTGEVWFTGTVYETVKYEPTW